MQCILLLSFYAIQCSTFYTYNETRCILCRGPLYAGEIGAKGARGRLFYVASFVSGGALFRAIRQMRGNITLGHIKCRRSDVFRREMGATEAILFSALIAQRFSIAGSLLLLSFVFSALSSFASFQSRILETLQK